ncbi:hypothetical protein FRB99_005092 [Tulasnella sp. 403]|nr:hypothetical protein FRB99_005092 [Tulasnella sp. 403]
MPDNGISALEFSGDGHYLAVVFNEVVQIMSTATWTSTMELAFPRACTAVRGLKFSPSNDFLALGTGDVDFAVWVWDLRSGELHKTLLGMTENVWGVDISADDTFVVACSAAPSDVRLWRLDDDKGKVLDLSISPAAAGIAAADEEEGTLLATLSSGDDAVLCVKFSPDGSWLFGSNINGEVRRWDVGSIRKGKSEASCTMYRPKGSVEGFSTLSVSPDNAWFAVISADHGDVHVMQSNNPDSTRASSIGKVPTHGIWRCVNLGPMSNSASGLAVGSGGGFTGAAVYKYASWDFPGAYLV